jgi:hypothetical protein
MLAADNYPPGMTCLPPEPKQECLMCGYITVCNTMKNCDTICDECLYDYFISTMSESEVVDAIRKYKGV